MYYLVLCILNSYYLIVVSSDVASWRLLSYKTLKGVMNINVRLKSVAAKAAIATTATTVPTPLVYEAIETAT